MRTPPGLLPSLILAVLTAASAPLRAQDAPARADTVRGSEFSDGVISRAFGIPEATSEQVSLARERMQCMQTDDAVLCHLAAPDPSWNDCANIGLVGQFIVWFDLLEGRATDKQVYVAVECGPQVVTMSSRRRFPAFEFTLSSRNTDSAKEESRSVVFIQTGSE
jgi:hypothetical protein